MKWTYTSKALPDKGAGWCLIQAVNAKYYIAVYNSGAHEWRCQDTAWARNDPACCLRLDEDQVRCWVDIMAIRIGLELDENGEEPTPCVYENCRIEAANYSGDDPKFAFTYGGSGEAVCRNSLNAEKLTAAMARRKPVDICVEEGLIKAVEAHETAKR